MDLSIRNSSPAPTELTIAINKWDDLCDTRREPPKSACVYRVGPAPREDVNATDNAADIGKLDADMEEPKVPYSKTGKRKAAASKALIIYFAKMATKTNKENVDYRFLDSLFQGGAEVNVTDKHGQTVLHEVARNWNTDVAKFFISRGADVNKADVMGRSPLHLASAVNHYEMVEYLIDNGANIHAKTLAELQSPVHYAAKYNAVGSLKVLLDKKAMMNDRDYKQRTPIFLAAELAREDSARYLIDVGVPVGVFDDTGMAAIALMVEKMPHIAVDALNQFQVTDIAFRKDYFYLNYLEYNPNKWREENMTTDEFGIAITPNKKDKKKLKRQRRLACPTTALKLAVQLQEFEVIMHPVMQQLIKQKWNLFGKVGAVIGASIHLLYILIWTILAILLPREGGYYKGDEKWWRIPMEILGVLLTLFFVFRQVWESKIKYRENQNFRLWRTRQLNRDLDYCHPQWPQEKTFLQSEMKAIGSRGGGLLSDPWNILDFLTYLSVLVVIVTRMVSVFLDSSAAEKIHLRAYTAALIFMWLHFMKSCRPFTTLGPFITMLGHMMMDTITFAFLFFEFFIPYCIGFWILFGGYLNAEKMFKAWDPDGDDSDPRQDWERFNDVIFSTWQITLNVDFNFNGLVSVDRLMAQIMVGTFLALSTVLCLNLYIALLSETFNRVYSNAKANASLLQATTILQVESILSKKRAKLALDYIQDECGPLVTAQEPDEAGITEEELWDRTVRNILGRFDLFYDTLKEVFSMSNPISKKASLNELKMKAKVKEMQETYDLYKGLEIRHMQLYRLQCDVHDMKCTLLKYLGESGAGLPPRPKFVPFPMLPIKPPTQEMIKMAEPQKELQKLNKQKNNSVFRKIMDEKSSKGLEHLHRTIPEDDHEVEEELDDDDENSFGSWEDLKQYVMDLNVEDESHA